MDSKRNPGAECTARRVPGDLLAGGITYLNNGPGLARQAFYVADFLDDLTPPPGEIEQYFIDLIRHESSYRFQIARAEEMGRSPLARRDRERWNRRRHLSAPCRTCGSRRWIVEGATA